MTRPTSVLVVRKRDSFSDALTANGFVVSNLDLIGTEPVDELQHLDAHLSGIDAYDGMFFTSPAAAEVFIARAHRHGSRPLPKAYVLGNRAERILRDAGLDVIYDRSANTAEEFICSIGEAEFAGKRFLYVRGDKSLDAVPRLLGRLAAIEEVIVYRNIERPLDDSAAKMCVDQLRKGEIDWICFFSPSGVIRFTKMFRASIPEDIRIAVIGRTTAKEVRAADMHVSFTSTKASAEDFSRDLTDHINTN